MTQREIDKRVGLKGRTRQFTFPVSESSFSGDRVMFTDTGSITLGYSFDNKNGRLIFFGCTEKPSSNFSTTPTYCFFCLLLYNISPTKSSSYVYRIYYI